MNDIRNISDDELLEVLKKYIKDKYDFKYIDIHFSLGCIEITSNEGERMNIYIQVEDCEED